MRAQNRNIRNIHEERDFDDVLVFALITRTSDAHGPPKRWKYSSIGISKLQKDRFPNEIIFLYFEIYHLIEKTKT